jgi:enoyl-CoA hydratase/carnithine racemase
MLLTGDVLGPQQALQWGLVNKVVAAAELDAATAELAAKLAAKPPATVAAGKRAFYQQMDLSLEKAYELAGQVIASSFAHEEGREGMDAFIDKRPPPGKK